MAGEFSPITETLLPSVLPTFPPVLPTVPPLPRFPPVLPTVPPAPWSSCREPDASDCGEGAILGASGREAGDSEA
jgi:hypothetical protein